MKKAKWILAVAVVLGVFVNGSMAYAQTKQQLRVVAGEVIVTELSEAEVAELKTEMMQTGIGESAEIMQDTRAGSYTAYRYSQTFDFYDGDVRVARAVPECIVWHYTDGKVHLYSRTMTASSIQDYNIVKTYGQIVNTDGSLSYTSGDSVYISSFVANWEYAIDFRATPTEQSFSCYAI